MILLAFQRPSRGCPQALHSACREPLTAARRGPVAPHRDRSNSELAERDCGAAERETGTQSGQEAPGAEGQGVTRTSSNQGATKKIRSLSWGNPAEPSFPSTLKAQIPQRIWFRGRCFGQPRRRPLAMRGSERRCASLHAVLRGGTAQGRLLSIRPQRDRLGLGPDPDQGRSRRRRRHPCPRPGLRSEPTG